MEHEKNHSKHIWEPHKNMAATHHSHIPEQKCPKAFLSISQHFCKPSNAVPLLYLPNKRSNIKINMAQMLYQQTPTLLYPLLTSPLLLYCHLSIILPCHGLLWIEAVWAPICHVLFGRKGNMHTFSTTNSNYMLFGTTHLFSCPRVSCNL